nr:hypothetical protein [uncultured Albidiferax sp.]
MRKYLVTIVMEDGSVGQHQGLYANGFDAILMAMDCFATAHRISARRLP